MGFSLRSSLRRRGRRAGTLRIARAATRHPHQLGRRHARGCDRRRGGFRVDNSLSVWFEAADSASPITEFLGDFGHREWMLVALHGVANPGSRAADR
jgi:hypothetical protein